MKVEVEGGEGGGSNEFDNCCRGLKQKDPRLIAQAVSSEYEYICAYLID